MKKTLLSLVITSCISPLIFSPYAIANQHTDEGIERVVVTANRTQTAISDIAGTVWLVDLEQIETQINAGVDFKNALAQLIPSLDLGSQSRTNYSQNMRGRPMMVMIDGVSLNSSRGLSRHLDSIDPFNIARIEVISGSTAIYGGGSIGGVINIITKQGDGTTELNVGIKSGFAGHDDLDSKLAAATSWENQRSKGRISLAYSQVNAMYDGNGEPIMMDTTQSGLQYTRSLDLMASSTLMINDQQSISFLGQYYNNESDGEHGLYFGDNSGSLFGDMSDVGIRTGLESEHTPQTKRNLFNIDYQHRAFMGQNLNIQAFMRSEYFDFYPRPRLNATQNAVASFSSSEQSTDAYGFKFVLNKKWQSVDLAYGFDYDSEEFDAMQTYYDPIIAQASGGLNIQSLFSVDRYPGFEVDSKAFFAQLSWQVIERLSLSAGVRQQNLNNTVSDFVSGSAATKVAQNKAQSADAILGGSTDYDVTLFNFGAVFDVTDNQQVWTNFAQAFELPNVAKYYGKGKYLPADENGHLALQDGSTVSIGNSRLKGIKTDSNEFGWRYNNENLSAQLSVYQSQSDQTIVTNSKTLLIDVKESPLRTQGIEGQIDYDFNAAFRIGMSSHLVRGQSKTTQGEWAKIDVTKASSSKLTSYVAWQGDTLKARLQSKSMFDLSDDASEFNVNNEDRQIDGYTELDLIFNYPLSVGTVNFAITNLLDETYTTQWGKRAIYFYSPSYGPAALYDHKARGRSYTLDYSVKF
ncbi:TonB-dependent receptor [Pseudoalteromonas sp. S1727]|uniref:TonB-dependent receptor n=1 Tax=Pseudoalteromonas sp. S1727 TaxID=2066514 RepID=UPI001109E5F0|nr:TonB-dependent receptor [Pseudoalteromonas sp. S1727]TMN72539.1 TonB-dependent receptor [Pseudoalteromonas sp. S1727]